MTTSKKRISKKTKHKLDIIVKYLLLPIVAGVIVGVIVSFLKINDLEKQIEKQSINIQDNQRKIEILNVTVQQQNTMINKFQNEGVVVQGSVNRGMINTQHGSCNSQTNRYKKDEK
jgi:phosphate/sulfate permease